MPRKKLLKVLKEVARAKEIEARKAEARAKKALAKEEAIKNLEHVARAKAYQALAPHIKPASGVLLGLKVPPWKSD